LQALLVSLPDSGSVLLAGDAINTAEHVERDLWTQIGRASCRERV